MTIKINNSVDAAANGRPGVTAEEFETVARAFVAVPGKEPRRD